MDFSILWKLVNAGRKYRAQECRKMHMDSNETNARIGIYLLAHRYASQQEIAAAYSMEESTVARALKRLERSKCVVRKTNPADKRSNIISLTVSGAAKYTSTMEVHKKWARMISGSLSEEENAEFDRLCMKMIDSSEMLIDRE